VAVRHNLGQFAERMRKRGADIEPAVDDTVRKVALLANQTLIMATPVDTGRARANWQVSINAEVDSEVESTDAQGAMTRNKGVIDGYRGGELLIQNNVPYIGALNNGSSAQAPAGFVEKALQAAAKAVARSKLVR
jgi:hypothetical protein